MIRVVDTLVRTMTGRRIPVDVPLPPGVQVRRSRLFPWLGGVLARLDRPAAAVTLGRTILVHPDIQPGERLLRHELAHVAQWMRAPLAFPFCYTGAHIRHGYRDNPYEVEARAAEARTDDTGEIHGIAIGGHD
jgi:hypothetical protein